MYKWMLIIILMLGTPGCVYEPPISKGIPKDDSKNVAAKTSGKTVRQLASSGLFSALGRLDTRSRVRFLGAQRAGVLEQVFVELGDTVAQGQPLAKLMCATQEADQAVAAAQVRSSQARLLQLRAGARQGTQQEALELLAAAEQRATTVADEYRRRLNNKAYETTRTLERLRHESAEANALVNAARAKVADLDAGPRVVDLATREAEVAAASASLAKAEAEVGLCTVAAPVSGEVLHIAARAGEFVGGEQHLLVVADTSDLIIRAEVEDRDVHKLQIGAQVMWKFLGENTYHPGRVYQTSGVVGRHTARTADPASRFDRDVLEVLIEVEPGMLASRSRALAIGRQTVVQIAYESTENLSVAAPPAVSPEKPL